MSINQITVDKQVFSNDIQSAVNYLNGNPGVVYVGSGTFILDSRVTLPSGTIIEGTGPSTIIKASDSFGAAIGTNPIYGVEGEAMFVNTASSQNNSAYQTVDSNIIIRNLVIDGNGSNQQRIVHGVGFQYVDNALIENVDFKNFGKTNLDPEIISTEASGNRISQAVISRNCTNFTVKNGNYTSTGGIWCVLGKRNSFNSLIMHGGTSTSIKISSSQNIIVETLKAYSNENTAIYVDKSVGGAGVLSKNITVTDFTIDGVLGTANYVSQRVPGIYASSTTNLTINTGYVGLAYGSGLELNQCSNYNIDFVNFVDNNTSGSSVNKSSSIYISGSGTSPEGRVTNCTMEDTRGTSLVRNHIFVNGSIDNLLLRANFLRKSAKAGIYIGQGTMNRVDLIGNESSFSGEEGVRIEGNDPLSIPFTNFTLRNNNIHDSNRDGVYESNLRTCNISDNQIYNNGYDTSVPRYGLHINGLVKSKITGNNIFDDKSIKTQSYSIYEELVNATYYSDNQITNNNLGSGLSGTYRYNTYPTTVGTPLAAPSERYNNYGAESNGEARKVVLTNSSGSTSANVGDVVIQTNDTNFGFSTVSGDKKTIGIACSTIAPSTSGYIQTKGVFQQARVNGSILYGAGLALTNTNNRLKTAASGELLVAVALGTNVSGDGNIDVLLVEPRTY